MDNVDWANLNTFKNTGKLKFATKLSESAKVGQANEQENDEDEGDDDDENEREEAMEGGEEEEESMNKTDQTEMFKKMLEHMKPGENILKAIKRLGNSSKSDGVSSGTASANLSASQRWLKKKTPPVSVSNNNKDVDPEKAKADKEALEKLTGYSNYFIDRGFYDIYEETYESLERKIENSENAKSTGKDAFDIFADDVDESELKSTTNPSTNNTLLEGID